MSHISVIIAAYNAATYLPLTVTSVLEQSFSDWELILVNDGSTDETGAICDQFATRDARIRVLHQANQGVAIARNFGTTALSPDSSSVVFLDADDIYETDALELLTRALNDAPTAVAAYGAARFIDGEGNQCLPGQAEALSRKRRGVSGRRLIDWPRQSLTSFAVMVFQNPIWTPGQVVVRQSALEQVKGFDPELSGVADWDFWLRLSRIGDLVCREEVVLNYRRHGSNMSSRDDLMRRDELDLRRKITCSSEYSTAQRRNALRGYQFSERSFAKLYINLARQQAKEHNFLVAAKYLVKAIIRFVRSRLSRVI